MINSNGNNQIHAQIGGYNSAGANIHKTSANKYYNIFNKKMEEIELPNIDLEFNAVLPEKSSFMRTT